MMTVDEALQCADDSEMNTGPERILAAEVRRLREDTDAISARLMGEGYEVNAGERITTALHEMICDMQELREKNEQLRKDAERYQWLRELVSSTVGTIQAQGLFWNCSHSRRKLDAAIDAARSAKALPEPAP